MQPVGKTLQSDPTIDSTGLHNIDNEVCNETPDGLNTSPIWATNHTIKAVL